jgi:hypothetical protein
VAQFWDYFTNAHATAAPKTNHAAYLAELKDTAIDCPSIDL